MLPAFWGAKARVQIHGFLHARQAPYLLHYILKHKSPLFVCVCVGGVYARKRARAPMCVVVNM